jgi:hypothetical protein
MIDLDATMRELAALRPVFHSEADFQHALAMQISGAHPGVKIRLESRPVSAERVYLDLWVEHEGHAFAIELKYKTRKVSVEWGGERFDLASHGAQDLGAYDVLKDVQRIELLRGHRPEVEGSVIFLTNDATYWNPISSDGTVGAAFRLGDGRVLTGELAWAVHAGPGTTKNREAPIVLHGTYQPRWHDYSHLGSAPGLSLRYTIIPVDGTAQIATQPTQVGRAAAATPQGRRRSKYSPLHDFLVAHGPDRVDLTYARIEDILGSSLPPSSRTHAAQFWANHYGGTHVWATQWMDAGWKVAGLSPGADRVTFVRVGPPRV